ncbi:hypothetical protein DBW_1866 [Desulfuromonas sp. DDH964]|uniref:hypothetical protein n=1 Tax=Desulfuromonas sp. DDH964 TaxID=1823759 RepID=UPI00078EA10F|nr:hypothetical protein [Desulfuromonas sp. DDH964]AMV72220.1 hypothetical protein DBW_1866 [Desulfuromonas sp. DDH964]
MGHKRKKEGSALTSFAELRADEIRLAASDARYRQRMLTVRLKSLNQCVSPRRSRSLYGGGSLEFKAEIAEQLLAEVALDLQGLLKSINAARVATKSFIAAVRADDRKVSNEG